MLLGTLLAVTLAAGATEKPKIAVMDFTAGGGADPAVASALAESVGIELSQRGLFEVVTSRDVQTLIGVERQKQLLGCSDEAQSCMAELANALGAKFVLTGSLTQLGSTLQLNLQTIDSQTTKAIGRATRIAADASDLRRGLPWVVAEATGIPAPPEPSRALPYSLIGGGAALTVGGAVVGLLGFTQERQLVGELQLADSGRATLQPLEYYQSRAAQDRQLTIGGAAAAGVGVALIVTGALINRAADSPSTSVEMALVPTANGAALVGVLP